MMIRVDGYHFLKHGGISLVILHRESKILMKFVIHQVQPSFNSSGDWRL